MDTQTGTLHQANVYEREALGAGEDWAIVHALLTVHGGSITLDDAADGTCFRVHLET